MVLASRLVAVVAVAMIQVAGTRFLRLILNNKRPANRLPHSMRGTLPRINLLRRWPLCRRVPRLGILLHRFQCSRLRPQICGRGLFRELRYRLLFLVIYTIHLLLHCGRGIPLGTGAPAYRWVVRGIMNR